MKTIATLAACMLTSCAGLISGITGQPVAYEKATLSDGATINVAAVDLIRARQSPPETVWGLYDAGAVARNTAEVIAVGK